MPAVWYRLAALASVLFLLVVQAPRSVPAVAEQLSTPAQVGQVVTPREEEGEDEVRERQEYFHDQRAAPAKQIPAGALLRARQQAAQVASAAAGPSVGAQVTESSWTSIGPRPIGLGASGFANGALPNSGRVTAIAAVDANLVYIGAASGGVWKTIDGGVNWTPLTDDQPSLAIGALAIDPTNPNVIYAGLGEDNNSLDSYYGFGVLKSTDAGSTWTLSNASIFSRESIGRIVIDPSNPNVVYASSSNGVAKSTDGGVTWVTAFKGGSIVSDVAIDVTNPQTIYAAVGDSDGSSDNGVWKSTDGGSSWSRATGTGTNRFPSQSVGRIRTSMTQSAPATLYAVVHRVSDDGIMGVWKTNDGAVTWRETAHPETSSGASGGSICFQCWYDLNISVFPTNPNVVYVLGVEAFKSTDGGATWTLISNAYTPPYRIHADQHGFAFIPGNPDGFYLGNDGGVYRSLDAGASFTQLNDKLSITQFWRGGAHPTNLSSAIGGSQDNGPLSYENSLTWYRPFTGDGGYSLFDYDNPSIVYTSSQFLGLAKSTTGPRGDYSFAASGIASHDDEARQFIAPVVMDPNDPQRLYAGTTRLYRSNNAAQSWVAISPDLSSASTNRTSISTIGVSASNPSTIYVGTGSSSAGASRLWVTTDGGVTWLNKTAGLPNRFPTSIAVHPTNGQIAWVAFSGFDTGHVYKTVDGGASWTNSSGSLANAPVNAIIVDRFDAQVVYVGTDVGVFKSADGGSTWASLNTGLPNVVVMDLVLNRAGSRLFAFTHGRGVYVSDRSGVAPTPTATVGSPVPTHTPTHSPTITPTTGPAVSCSGQSPPPSAAAPSQQKMAAPNPGRSSAARGGPAGGARVAASIPYAPTSGRTVLGSDATTLTCETFEGTWPSASWTSFDGNGSLNGDYCWGRNTFQARFGQQSAWPAAGCGDGLDPNAFFYPHNVDSWMVYGPFSLAGATAANVHFSLWHQMQPGDSLFWGASTDNASFSGVTATGNTTNVEPPTTAGWRDVDFDLSTVPGVGSLLGQPSVYVAWRFQSNSSGLDDGPFIDDVLIQRQGGASLPTPTVIGTGVGGKGFGINSSSSGVRLSWQGGTQQTGYTVLRLAAGTLTVLPGGPLPANATEFLDSTAPPGLDCYAILPLGTNPQQISDVLCAGVGIQTSTGSPRDFTLRLNQSSTATMTWAPPLGGNQTNYMLLTIGRSLLPLGATQTSVSQPAQGLTCFVVGTLVNGELVGYTDFACGEPGHATISP